MWEFIHKIILLFLERKNKFKSAEDRYNRRAKYFDNLKIITDLNINEFEKRALRNSAAQELAGSQLISYELMHYLLENKNITNFEIISKNLVLWDNCLDIIRNKNNQIVGISLNNKTYIKEKITMFFLSSFMVFFLFIFILTFKKNVLWLQNAILLPEHISIIILISLFLLLLLFILFFYFITIMLFDLKRIVKLINR